MSVLSGVYRKVVKKDKHKHEYDEWIKFADYDMRLHEVESENYKLKEENNRLLKENDRLRSVHHRFNVRLRAMELSGHRAEGVGALSSEYKSEIGKLSAEIALQSTGIQSLDDLFVYFLKECTDNEINFVLNITCDVKQMVEKVIPSNELEVLAGDHIKNAIKAVVECDSTVKTVVVLIGESYGNYYLTVLDSGIPFQTGILQRLGKERVTTGGNGYGFETTFNILKNCKASLIITEVASNEAGIAKSVSINFDKREKYIIRTYRVDEIEESDRYDVVKI